MSHTFPALSSNIPFGLSISLTAWPCVNLKRGLLTHENRDTHYPVTDPEDMSRKDVIERNIEMCKVNSILLERETDGQ